MNISRALWKAEDFITAASVEVMTSKNMIEELSEKAAKLEAEILNRKISESCIGYVRLQLEEKN